MNVLDALPQKLQAEGRELLTKIPYTETREAAERQKAEFQAWATGKGEPGCLRWSDQTIIRRTMRTVFLSSTAKDLAQAREKVYEAIEGLEGYHCVRMENFGGWDVAADEFCRAKVGECDLVVCLAGPLYGSLTPAGPSYTEREFDSAMQHTKPCLVFMTREDFPLSANLTEPDDRRSRQADFRKRLLEGRIVARFSTPDQAAVQVVQAIRNWEIGQAGTRAPGGTSVLRIRRVAPVEDPAWASHGAALVTIGRSPQSSVHVDDPEASWEHGQIVLVKGQYRYRHVSETNPTFISRTRKKLSLRAGHITEETLRPQDRLTIGGTTLVVDFDLVSAVTGYSPTAKRPGR